MLQQFRRLYRKKGVQRFYIGGAIGVNLWAIAGLWQIASQMADSVLHAAPFTI